MDLVASSRETMNRYGVLASWNKYFAPVVARLPMLLRWVLLVMIAYALAQLTWKLVPGDLQEAGLAGDVFPATKNTGTSQSKTGKNQSSRLANLHLFGKVEATAKATKKKRTAVAPPTTLKLTLFGVFVTPDPKQGEAIIGKAGKGQQYYRTGDTVSDGRILAEVYNDHVILDRNGSFETLRFPKEFARAPVRQPSKNTLDWASKNDTKPSNLGEFKDLFSDSPEKLLDHLRFLPVKTAGQLKGFRILPQRDRTLYRQLGLQPADIVTSVNGLPLTDESQALELIENLQESDQLVLQVERRGETRTMTLGLE